MIGTTISHYKILEKLGEGGMGVVYKAQDTKLLRPVALKFLSPEMTRDQDAKKRFIREARAASALDHPNIAVVHDVDETKDGHSFICMAYYDGQTLKSKFARGPLSVDESVRLALQIVSGLQRAHESNIVHRDIKPGNIIITSQGEVKIVDFGLAKLMSQGQETKTLVTGGTAAYMAPEQILGSEADARSDLFSFGVVLYEAVVGKRPFAGEHEAALYYSIVNSEPPPPSSIRPEIPPELERIILKLLQKNPANRYQHAVEVYDDLKHFLGETPTPRPVAQIRRVFLNKSNIALTAVGAIVVALALLLASGTLQRWLGGPHFAGTHYIGIMPFNAIGADSVQLLHSLGIYEQVVSRLVQMHEVLGKSHLCPASEIRKYINKSLRDAQLGCGITLAIEGTIQWTRSEARATVTLVDLEDLSSIDSKGIEAPSNSPAELEGKLVRAIAEMLSGRLTQAQILDLTVKAPGDERASDYYYRARGELLFYIDAARLNSSIRLFQRAIALDTLYTQAHAGLAEAYWRKFSLSKDVQWADSAISACDRAEALEKNLVEVKFMRGLIYHGTGKDDLAIQEYQSLLAVDTANAAAWMELGEALGISRNRERAEEAYRKAIALNPLSWQPYHYLARALANNKEYAAAIDVWRKGLQLAPGQPLMNNGFGVASFALDNWTDAIIYLNRAIAADSTRYPAYANLGTAYYYDGMMQEAIKAYLKARELNENDHMLWAGLGAAYRELGSTHISRQAYEKAATLVLGLLRLNPQNPQLLSQLACYYADLGKKNEARSALAKALAISPNDRSVLARAVACGELLGDRKQAIVWLQKFLDAGGSPTQEIRHSPEMKGLRESPEYHKIVTNVSGKGAK